MDKTIAYAILGASPGDVPEEIRRRFRVLANLLHPDRYLTPGERAVATLKFQQLTEAFTLIRRLASTTVAGSAVQASPVAAWQPPGSDRAGVSAWDLLEPLKRKLPGLDFVLDMLLIPTLIPLVLLALPVRLLGGLPKATPRIANLFYTLSAHFLPGVCVLVLGIASLPLGNWWDRAFGAWLIVGGAVSILLELVAQGIGTWRLMRRPVGVVEIADVDAM